MSLERTGETLDTLHADDAAAWYAQVYRWLVEGYAAGWPNIQEGWRTKFEWGGPGVPLVDTFGKDEAAARAAQAHEAMIPPAARGE